MHPTVLRVGGGTMGGTHAALTRLQEEAKAAPIRAAVVLGTGLGPLAEQVEAAITIPYRAFDGFPENGVSGHAGTLVVGRLEGACVAMLAGREHAYERGRADAMRAPLELVRSLGADVLVLTNSAGSLRPEVRPGAAMLITDHINFAGLNPLTGETGDERFVDLSAAYDAELRARLHRVAAARGIPLAEGVYIWFRGPSFETPAEIRASRVLGADAVGMSTVPEVILARRLGMRVAALSLVTNLAAGMGPPLSHAETKRIAAEGAERIGVLVRGLLRSLADDCRS